MVSVARRAPVGVKNKRFLQDNKKTLQRIIGRGMGNLRGIDGAITYLRNQKTPSRFISDTNNQLIAILQGTSSRQTALGRSNQLITAKLAENRPRELLGKAKQLRAVTGGKIDPKLKKAIEEAKKDVIFDKLERRGFDVTVADVLAQSGGKPRRGTRFRKTDPPRLRSKVQEVSPVTGRPVGAVAQFTREKQGREAPLIIEAPVTPRPKKTKGQQFLSDPRRVSPVTGRRLGAIGEFTREKQKRILEELKKGTLTSTEISTSSRLLNKLEKVSPKLFYAIVSISSRREQLRRQQSRKRTAQGQIELAGLAFLDGLLQNVEGVVNLPVAVSKIAKDPSRIKIIWKGLVDETKAFVVLFKTSPLEAVARIGADIVFLKGTAKAISFLSKTKSNVLARLSPDFKGVARAGQKLKINLPKGAVATLTVVAKLPKRAIPKQLQLAGTKVKVAISSQADALLGNIISRSKKIAKPLGKTIPKTDKITQNLLKRLDKGTITKKELGILDRRLQTKYKIKGVLERSFFADPTGKIRPSRLGVVGSDAPTFLDIIKGNFTFRGKKPQILLFTNITVEKFPKYLSSVIRKLKKGQKLTRKETNELLYFQTRQTNKFKPLGFVSRESEITLPQGAILKRVKQVGVTLVNGKRVPIILTEVYKPTKALKKLIKDYADGKLTKKQIKLLDAKLKKNTGINYGLSSVSSAKKVLSLRKLIASRLLARSYLLKGKKQISKAVSSKKALSRKPLSKKAISKTSKGRTSRKGIRKTSRFSPTKTSKTSKTVTSKTSKFVTSRSGKVITPKKTSLFRGGSGIYRTGKGGITKFPPKLPAKLPANSDKGKGYFIYTRRAGRYYRVNDVPYTKGGANKLGKFVTNRSVRASFFIVRADLKPRKTPKYITSTPNKYFRSKKPKSKLKPRSSIEKRKYRINTAGEKRGLSVAQVLTRARRNRSTTNKKATKKRTVKRKTIKKSKARK